MNFLISILSTFSTPSKFDQDWYGYATNQISHVGLGMFFVWFFCVFAFVISGDMPSRWQVFLSIAVMYGAKELAADRWQGADTIEDFLFLVVYGAGGALISFKQMDALSPNVVFSVFQILPFLLVCCVHLLIGLFIRWKAAL